MSSHPIVHIEISSIDRVATSKYLQDVFGWESQQLPEMNYATFMSQETLGGGFNPISKDNPAGTVKVYIGTDDIGSSLAKINAAGGKTIAPQAEIPGMGWFAIVRYPTGNTLALFKEMSK